MNNDKPYAADVHRFCDSVAVAFLGIKGQTVYMSAKEARSLARALHACARSIDSVTFSASNFPTTEIPLNKERAR